MSSSSHSEDEGSGTTVPLENKNDSQNSGTATTLVGSSVVVVDEDEPTENKTDTQNSGEATTLVGSSVVMVDEEEDEPMEIEIIEIPDSPTPSPQKVEIKEGKINHKQPTVTLAAPAVTPRDQGPPVKCKCVKMGPNRVPMVVKPIQPCFAETCLIQLTQQKFLEFLQKSMSDPSPPAPGSASGVQPHGRTSRK